MPRNACGRACAAQISRPRAPTATLPRAPARFPGPTLPRLPCTGRKAAAAGTVLCNGGLSAPRAPRAFRRRTTVQLIYCAPFFFPQSIDTTLQNQTYNHNKVAQWTSNCVEQCLKRLTALNKPFKYIVTCIIMQKTGAGLHTASSCYWDNGSDGSCTYKWENKSMYCICTVFGLAI